MKTELDTNRNLELDKKLSCMERFRSNWRLKIGASTYLGVGRLGVAWLCVLWLAFLGCLWLLLSPASFSGAPLLVPDAGGFWALGAWSSWPGWLSCIWPARLGRPRVFSGSLCWSRPVPGSSALQFFGSSFPSLVSFCLVLCLFASRPRLLSAFLVSSSAWGFGLRLLPTRWSLGQPLSGPGLAWPSASQSPSAASDGTDHLRLSSAVRLLSDCFHLFPSPAASKGWLSKEPRTCFCCSAASILADSTVGLNYLRPFLVVFGGSSLAFSSLQLCFWLWPRPGRGVGPSAKTWNATAIRSIKVWAYWVSFLEPGTGWWHLQRLGSDFSEFVRSVN